MSGASRRAVVRAGVTSAWAAPFVLVAVPASAAVCSGGLTPLTATEVPGTRVETFNPYRGELAVSVRISVTNPWTARALVSATVLEDAEFGGFLSFKLGRVTSGDIGTAAPVGDENLLTVTASPKVPLAAQGTEEFIVEYALNGSPAQYRTITVTFQPDCGLAGVCTIVSYNGPT